MTRITCAELNKRINKQNANMVEVDSHINRQSVTCAAHATDMAASVVEVSKQLNDLRERLRTIDNVLTHTRKHLGLKTGQQEKPRPVFDSSGKYLRG